MLRKLRESKREVFMPLVHRPGEAQVDYGYALAKVAGILRQVAFFIMCLPFSDAMFVMVCEKECTESFWEGHVRAFEFFGGVPRRITYDNSRVMIKNITGCHQRKLTDGFLQLQSHYLFEEHFCTVRRANEKGVVEGCVKYARLNFMVPVPEVRDLEELNQRLLESCDSDLDRQLRKQTVTKRELLKEEQIAFIPVPAVPFDACLKITAKANSLSLVRFKCNDYSVLTQHAHQEITIKGYMNRVVLCRRDEKIGEHERLWGKGGVVFDPFHYLALLERKPGTLDHGRPFEDWDLPECFGVLRRRMEIEEKKPGDGAREYIQVLLLMENHSLDKVAEAIKEGLRIRAHTRDAIAQFLYPRERWEEATFSLVGREHLRYVKVKAADLEGYRSLLPKGGGI